MFCLGLKVLRAQTVKDIDGNIYKTVTIGTQVWMAENLKTTRYNDSTSIPLVLDNKTWKSLTTPAYCWYDNDETANKNTYGALYNWYTVKTGKLCPAGWHIPTDVEWTKMATYLGGTVVAFGKLKETGTTHWNSPNNFATNETGFTALPSGSRGSSGAFYFVGEYGYWWSSTKKTVWYVYTYNGNVNRLRSGKRDSFSVRCLQDF